MDRDAGSCQSAQGDEEASMTDVRRPFSTGRVNSSAAGCPSSVQEVSYQAARSRLRCNADAHRGQDRGFAARAAYAARLRARTNDREVALGAGMAGARLDRQTRVVVEPVRRVPVVEVVLVRRVELVRDPAAEPVPAGVARPSRGDVAGSGRLARLLCRGPVRAT